MEKTNLTLASLFDGIGGFPYAASFYGIRSLWASEIVPECIGAYCMLSDNPAAGIRETDTSRTLDLNGGNPCCQQGGIAVVNAVDCRNLRETAEISGTLQAKTKSGGYSLNYQNPIRIGFCVRRLTPLEAERLMGFADFWTEYGHDGKPISDTKRYSMLGNSIAVPCVAYIMQGIRDVLLRERR